MKTLGGTRIDSFVSNIEGENNGNLDLLKGCLMTLSKIAKFSLSTEAVY